MRPEKDEGQKFFCEAKAKTYEAEATMSNVSCNI